jgi:hypothetical protein
MREFRLGGAGQAGLVQEHELVLDDADYASGQFFFVADPTRFDGWPATTGIPNTSVFGQNPAISSTYLRLPVITDIILSMLAPSRLRQPARAVPRNARSRESAQTRRSPPHGLQRHPITSGLSSDLPARRVLQSTP